MSDDTNVNDFANDLDEDSGYNEFLKSFLDTDASAKKPSEETPEVTEKKTAAKTSEEPEDEETPPKGEEEDADDEETTEDDGDDKAERKYGDDDAYVKIKIGDKEEEVAVKDLKRLYGQESSLTQKSQKVSEQQKQLDAELAKNTAATQALLSRAKARFEPYSKIDFLLASQKLSPEEYTALRNEAMRAHEDVQFLEQHLGEYMKTINDAQQKSLGERAQAAIKELAGDDPALSIPGWNEQAYNELASYATTHFGVPKEVMSNLVDAWGFRVLHKAMLWDKSQKSPGQNVEVKKVNKTPKRVVKTTTTPAAAKSSGSPANKAMARLQKTGSTDDAANAFLERWNDDAA